MVSCTRFAKVKKQVLFEASSPHIFPRTRTRTQTHTHTHTKTNTMQPGSSSSSDGYTASGKKILCFMRSVPRLKAVVANFLASVPPRHDACVQLGRRLQHLCEAWKKDVQRRHWHALLNDVFLIRVYTRNIPKKKHSNPNQILSRRCVPYLPLKI